MLSSCRRERQADINRRKQVARAKPKKSTKEQLAQAQANSTSRDTTTKPSPAPRKPSEAQAKPATPPPKLHLEEPHVPLNNFNAVEVEFMLRTGASGKAEVYRPDRPAPKAGGSGGGKRKWFPMNLIVPSTLKVLQQGPWQMARTSGSS